MSRIFTTTLRLNLDEADDLKAFEYLQRLDRKQYRSYSRAIVAAVNDYFTRKEMCDSDPYLETREKEDAFLLKIERTIRDSLQACAPLNVAGLVQLLQGAQQPGEASSLSSPVSEQEEGDILAALDFADSF